MQFWTPKMLICHFIRGARIHEISQMFLKEVQLCVRLYCLISHDTACHGLTVKHGCGDSFVGVGLYKHHSSSSLYYKYPSTYYVKGMIRKFTVSCCGERKWPSITYSNGISHNSCRDWQFNVAGIDFPRLACFPRIQLFLKTKQQQQQKKPIMLQH